MIEPSLNDRREVPFKPGQAYRHLDLGDNIEHAPPATIAFAAIAGNHRAVEFVYGDDGIPQDSPLPLSNDIECTKCCKMKPRSAFTRDNRKHNGLSSACRECERIRVKRFRLRRASWFEDGLTG